MTNNLTNKTEDGTVELQSLSHWGLHEVKVSDKLENQIKELKSFYKNQYSKSEEFAAGDVVLFQDFGGENRTGIILGDLIRKAGTSATSVVLAYKATRGEILIEEFAAYRIIEKLTG